MKQCCNEKHDIVAYKGIIPARGLKHTILTDVFVGNRFPYKGIIPARGLKLPPLDEWIIHPYEPLIRV